MKETWNDAAGAPEEPEVIRVGSTPVSSGTEIVEAARLQAAGIGEQMTERQKKKRALRIANVLAELLLFDYPSGERYITRF